MVGRWNTELCVRKNGQLPTIFLFLFLHSIFQSYQSYKVKLNSIQTLYNTRNLVYKPIYDSGAQQLRSLRIPSVCGKACIKQPFYICPINF